MNWLPIETAPKDGTEVIVGFDCATVWIVHSAFYRASDEPGFYECGFTEKDVGWWSYVRGSVTQEQLDDWREPTHWIPMPEIPVPYE